MRSLHTSFLQVVKASRRQVRNGNLSRESALEIYNKAPFMEDGLVEYFKKRLDLTDESFNKIMSQPLRTFEDFPTYKGRFEALRPVFYFLAKANLVPMSFYLKYCFPLGVKRK